MPSIVAKFGGSSLSCSKQFIKVKNIVEQDKRRKFIVPSAPGKRNAQDSKITDLLLECFYLNERDMSFEENFSKISKRFIDIKNDLKLNIDIENELKNIWQNIISGASSMYVASRGEYLNALLLAEFLGYNFFDPTQAVFFTENGAYNAERSNRVLAEKLSELDNAVMPGFYGAMPNGEVCTFSRGGSDISGAIMARAVCADVYENWTDVSGFFMADPSIVENPLEIKSLSYKELRELKYMQAGVLHEDAIYPVQKIGITTNIRNTNFPEHPGTLIVKDADSFDVKPSVITGVAGKTGFDIIRVDKTIINGETGIAMRLLQAFCECNIEIEHIVSSVAQMSIVIKSDVLSDLELKERLLVHINELVKPHYISIDRNLALLAIVGRSMKYSLDCNARIFSALSKANIKVKSVLKNNSQISTILAIDSSKLKKAINIIYHEFV